MNFFCCFFRPLGLLWRGFLHDVWYNFRNIFVQFRCHFGIILASFWCHFGALGCHWATQGPQDAPRRFQNRFCLHFGVPLGPLGAPVGVTFRYLWPSRGPENRKKRRTEGCLFAGSIFDRIFFTFWVPGTRKNKDSVWEGYTKPHFRPRPKKRSFGAISVWF